VDLIFSVVAGIAAAVLLLGLVVVLRRYVRLLRPLTFPFVIAAIAFGLWVFRRLQPEHAPSVDQFFIWLVALFLAATLIRVVGLYYFEIFLHGRRGLRLPPLLIGASFFLAYVAVGLLLLVQVFERVSIAPLLATSAVTSLVLGLALQPILGNFFAGLVLTVERPFRINDWVNVNGIEGRVVDITWRTTHLRTRDNDNLVIPNGKIAEQEILNYFYPQPLHMERINIRAHYATPPHRIERALLDAAGRVEGLLERPSPAVYLLGFEDSSILYELRVWTEDIAGLPRIESQCRREIWEEFRRRDIVMPYPIRTLELDSRARTLEVVNVEQPTPRPIAATLWVAEGPDRGRAIALDSAPVLVGRSSHCDLALSEPQVSKEHFRVELEEGGYVLSDLESSVGTVVNGERVARRPLNDLDRIAIGDTILIFEHHD
jgi:small-conductance mechanosensitive channel